MYEKIRRYFLEGLWNFPLRRQKGWRRVYWKNLRIASLAIRSFVQDRCMLHASSLTYYTVMASVPALAVSFAVARGFGYHEYLRNQLLDRFEQNREALLVLFTIVDKMIEQVKGGLLAAVGLIVLFWSIIQLLSNLESSLNEIWKVKKLRTWRRIFSDYFALMILGPCFFLLASSAAVFLVHRLISGIQALSLNPFLSGILIFIAGLIPYCLFWFLFTFTYLFMPNTKVPFSSAFLGGVIGGSLYVVVQWIYLFFQFGLSRYGTIYGSFAALPLFLIWVQISWLLLLFGAQISHADQTFQQHEFEASSKRASLGYKRLLSLWIVHTVVARFLKGDPPLTCEMLLGRYQIPYALISPLLDELTAAGLLLETPNGYLPAKPAGDIRIADVLAALDNQGASDFPFIDSEKLAPFERALNRFHAQIHASPDNKRLCHVPYSL